MYSEKNQKCIIIDIDKNITIIRQYIRGNISSYHLLCFTVINIFQLKFKISFTLYLYYTITQYTMHTDIATYRLIIAYGDTNLSLFEIVFLECGNLYYHITNRLLFNVTTITLERKVV